MRAGRAETLRGVREFLEAEHGMTLAATLGFENTYALAVRAADAERLALRAIGDLVPHAPRLAIGADVEFFARPEWPAVRGTYGLDFREQRAMDASLMYQAAATNEVDVISAYTTDGRIAAYDLRVLEDDRSAIPPYDAILLAGARLAREARRTRRAGAPRRGDRRGADAGAQSARRRAGRGPGDGGHVPGSRPRGPCPLSGTVPPPGRVRSPRDRRRPNPHRTAG